jgi:hypothetical protein
MAGLGGVLRRSLVWTMIVRVGGAVLILFSLAAWLIFEN